MQKLFAKIGRWTAELVLVFIGVYAAFALNSFQQHQQEAKRRDQILAALEQKVAEELDSVRSQGGKQKQDAAEFERALDAGEMPPLRALAYAPDYSPTAHRARVDLGCAGREADGAKIPNHFCQTGTQPIVFGRRPALLGEGD